MANRSALRISKEVHDVQSGSDPSLAVAFSEDNVRRVRALIVGPADTPYEFGFFEFRLIFSTDYPVKPPAVTFLTTNRGRTRFNPNFYADGKVCLSILGTWRGTSTEQWSASHGLESLLVSMQSMLSPEPYKNEPGFERFDDVDQSAAYSAKVRHETIRVTVLNFIETIMGLEDHGPTSENARSSSSGDAPYAPDFHGLVKQRFLWFYDTYLDRIEQDQQEHGDKVNDGTDFQLAEFECQSNGMVGTFNYTSLKKRLKRAKEAVDEETESWAIDAKRAVERESAEALSFQQKLAYVNADLKQRDVPAGIELVDGNPLVWRMSLFGRALSYLEGGEFKIRIHFCLGFPESDQPRVVVETPIFHHRVSKSGALCYVPTDVSDVKSHIDAIIDAIEDVCPAHDPRMRVNMEASALRWGDARDRREYGSKLRKCAEASAEG